MIFTVETMIGLANDAHRGQRDLAGQPYIRHPLRVMEAVANDGPISMCVGVGHDTIEDSKGKVTFASLEMMNCPIMIIEPLRLLTKEPGKKYSEADYMAMVREIAKHPVARRVKMADLRDNMDLTRLRGIEDGMAMSEADKDRIAKYAMAWGYLKSKG